MRLKKGEKKRGEGSPETASRDARAHALHKERGISLMSKG